MFTVSVTINDAGYAIDIIFKTCKTLIESLCILRPI